MAKKTLIIDDLTGESGARTRGFALDGVAYEIDLSDASYADLRAALKPFIRAARTVSGTSSAARQAGGSSSPRKAAGSASRQPRRGPAGDHTVIRAWAKAHGVAVTERGRVPEATRQAWIAAGSPR